MFMTRFFNKVRPQQQYSRILQTSINQLIKNENLNVTLDKSTKTSSLTGDISSKYQVYCEENTEVILDIYEQNDKYGNLLEEQEEKNPFLNFSLERGIEGVFDIEDLVDVLHQENAQDIFVASVPKTMKYVDYICVVTGKSNKHMQALAEFVRTLFKKKMHKTDIIPKLEGSGSKNWIALDLGNIALHIFSREGRELYDLDSLWSVGPQFDDECNKKDPVAEMLKNHSAFLKDLKPAS